MKTRNVILILWLAIMALVIASLAMTAKVQAQSCDPATGACPPPSSGSGGGGKKRPTLPPIAFTATLTTTPTATSSSLMGAPLNKPDNPIYLTMNACITATLQSSWLTAAKWTPPPDYHATQAAVFNGCYNLYGPTATKVNVIVPPVAGPVFLRPGVISMIIAGLVVLLAGALILVFRNR